MNRADFLKLSALAPVAALAGCRKGAEVGLPAPVMAEKPIQATAWTMTSSNNSTVTLWVQEANGRWRKA